MAACCIQLGAEGVVDATEQEPQSLTQLWGIRHRVFDMGNGNTAKIFAKHLVSWPRQRSKVPAFPPEDPWAVASEIQTLESIQRTDKETSVMQITLTASLAQSTQFKPGTLVEQPHHCVALPIPPAAWVSNAYWLVIALGVLLKIWVNKRR